MEPAPEVRDTYLQFSKALTSGDASTLSVLFSRDPGTIEIGTNPDAWTEGPEHIIERLTRVARQIAGTSIEPGEVQAFQEGTVAWLADRPVMTSPEGMKVSARVTAVFRREDDSWKIVQSHISMGRPLTS